MMNEKPCGIFIIYHFSFSIQRSASLILSAVIEILKNLLSLKKNKVLLTVLCVNMSKISSPDGDGGE